jgi:hypothetical protein
MNNLLQELDQSRAEHQAALEKIREIQKQKEWLQSRRGKFTASEFHRLMGYEDKKEFPKGAETYAIEKATEALTTEGESFSSDSMDRGNDKEVEGAEYFMEVTGLKVENYGKDQEFVELGKDVGATPDGRIYPDGGIEGKAPNSKTHFFYLTNLKDVEDFKKHCKNYYWQCQGNMYVTGAKYWYFFSYDDRFKNPDHRLFYLKVERNEEDIAKLKSRLITAIARRNQFLKQL